MDPEFKSVWDKLPHTVVNTTGANEHMGEIERKIRLIKERCRGTLNTLPYKILPKRILIELVYFHVLWLNAFPTKNGIFERFSPRELVLHHRLDYKNIAKLPSAPTVKSMMSRIF